MVSGTSGTILENALWILLSKLSLSHLSLYTVRGIDETGVAKQSRANNREQ